MDPFAVLLSGLAGLAIASLLYYFVAFREEPKPKFHRQASQPTENKNKNRKPGKGKRKKPSGGIQKKSTFSNSIGGTRTKGGKHELLVGTLPGQTDNIHDMAWSPNGKIVATLDQAGHLRVFTGITQAGEGQLSATVSTCTDLQGADRAICMPSDDLILVGMVRKRVAFVRIRKGKDKKFTFEKEKECEVELSFDIVKMVAADHPSIGTIVFMYDAGSDYIESINISGKSFGRMKIKQGNINDISISHDGKLLLVCTARQCNVFAVKPGQHCCLTKPSATKLPRPGTDFNNQAVFSAGFTERTNRIMAAGMDKRLITYSSDINWLQHESPKVLNETPVENTPKGKDVDLVTVIDEKTVALCIGPTIRFYDVNSNVKLAEIPNAAKFVKCRLKKAIWNAEKKMMCTCGNDKRVTFWKRPK